MVGVVGPPGIGKSRLVREAAEIARNRGVYVNSHYCESHATQIPFHAMAGMFRAAWIQGLGDAAVRAQVRARVPDADPEDMLLLDDLLGIADPDVRMPRIDPDARRRRLTALINAASMARTEPVLYVMEDVHWIDEVSESLLADVLAVVGQTPTMAVITYRPEYDGALTRVHGAQTIALTPLTASETALLIDELLGPDPSTDGVAAPIASRVAGNPFFAEEMVRELAQRGVLKGERGNYVCHTDVTEVTVPGTVQATIGARIDRLDPAAKRTLNAAAVIGMRFRPELLSSLGVEPAVDDLVRAELIDQVQFTPRAEYAFHHPLIRAVAYESQLRSDRSETHRRLATVIEADEPDSLDDNAALIAEHLDAAGEARRAYDWHMRAGRWSTRRDISAARASWERALRIADALPDDEPQRTAMRIATRTKLSGTAWRGFQPDIPTFVAELRELCASTGDNASLAVGIVALALQCGHQGQFRQQAELASEAMVLLESMSNPTLTIGAASAAASVLHEAGRSADTLRWSQFVIEWTGSDSAGRHLTRSPLTALALLFRGNSRWWLGIDGWRRDIEEAVAMAANTDIITHPSVVAWKYLTAIPHGVLRADDTAVRELEEALKIAEASGEDSSVGNVKATLGRVLADRDSSAERRRGLELLADVRTMCVRHTYFLIHLPVLDLYAVRDREPSDDFDHAVTSMRQAVDSLLKDGQVVQGIWGSAMLAEEVLKRGTADDLSLAHDTIENLANLADDVGGAVRDIWLLRLRALLAKARGDEDAYRGYRDRYREMATSLGFEGHMQWAEAMR